MTQQTKILDGKWLSEQLQAGIRRRVESAVAQGKRPPGLGVILVGDNPAAHAYVGNKEKLARACGLVTFDHRVGSNVSFEEVRGAIEEFNAHGEVDGILLQLPLPKHLDSNQLLDLISPAKDADGLHPLSQGLLMRGQGTLRPCTPLGAMKLIDLAYSPVIPGRSEFPAAGLPRADLSGKHAVVIGRSILVGKPVALLLLERNATVTVVHSKTPDLPNAVSSADIVVAAVGVPRLVKRSWVKPGAVVIDVGINRLPDGKLTGDVDFDDVAPIASAITPVPKGVGPMTVTMLIHNTVEAFRARTGLAI